MTVEDDISFLKYKLSESEKKIGNLESDLNKVRSQFAGFNGQFQEARQMFPQMQTKYNEVSVKFDIRMKTFETKLDYLLKLTKQNAQNRRDSGKPSSSIC